MTKPEKNSPDINPNIMLNSIVLETPGWVTKNTAILVVHGMGFQLPLETVDMFGRGLVKQYRKVFGDDLELSHEIVSKPDSGDKNWFDNVLRISKKNSPYYIDVYEYYWANYTEDKGNWNDLNKWLQGVVKGAKNFYQDNAQFGKLYKEKSIFFNTQTGEFISWRYRFFLSTISKLFFVYDQGIKFLIWLFNHIPFGGRVAGSIVEGYTNSITQKLTNFLIDLAAYVVVDPKSKFYCVRSLVLDGAVKALQYLFEKVKDESGKEIDLKELESSGENETATSLKKNYSLYYPSVIVAAHSLGTQISFDAINRINLMTNKNKISTYDANGTFKHGTGAPSPKIYQQFRGFITFGSPLDKIIFFLRENIPKTYYLKQQLLDDFHGFKQRVSNRQFNNAENNKDYVNVEIKFENFFQDVQWRNYYDDKDYISGGLDCYSRLVNVNCQFKAGTFGFTHSTYWEYDKFYTDIINNFID